MEPRKLTTESTAHLLHAGASVRCAPRAAARGLSNMRVPVRPGRAVTSSRMPRRTPGWLGCASSRDTTRRMRSCCSGAGWRAGGLLRHGKPWRRRHAPHPVRRAHCAHHEHQCSTRAPHIGVAGFAEVLASPAPHVVHAAATLPPAPLSSPCAPHPRCTLPAAASAPSATSCSYQRRRRQRRSARGPPPQTSSRSATATLLAHVAGRIAGGTCG